MENFNLLSKAYPLKKEEFQKLEKLQKLFLEENQKINLSAIRDEEGIWIKHIYDSLLALKYISDQEKIIDLGSGGGFPVLVMAIFFPKKSFFAVESVGKKCIAMEKFAKELDLKNFQVLSERAEILAQNEKFREKFDLVSARAFAKYPVLLEIGLAFLKVKGRLVAFRGPEHHKDDIKLAKLLKAETEIFHKKLPSGENREFWILEKFAKSDKRFPRNTGIPKKKPLSPDFF